MKLQLLRVLGDRPEHVNDGDLVMNASRPLLGTKLQCDLRGFTVVIAPDTYGRLGFIDQNRRLDASVIEWISREDAIMEERSRLAVAYGADNLDGITDDDWCDSWSLNSRRGSIDVPDADDAYVAYIAACEAENLDHHSRQMWDVHGQPSGPLGSEVTL